MTERQGLTVQQSDMLASKMLEHCRKRGVIGPGGGTAGWPSCGDVKAVNGKADDGLWQDFHKLRRQLYATFQVPRTTLTPLAARVLFGLAALHRPQRVAVFGCYAGNLMAWTTGSGFGPFARYRGDCAVGIDVDSDAIALASANFARAGYARCAQAVVADAFDAGQFAADGPWDLLLIDIDVPGARKSGYTRVLEGWLPQLSPGAVVVAHDVSHPVFAWDLRHYQDFVTAHGAAVSTTLPVDECGLEVTRWAAGNPLPAASTGPVRRDA